jgi:hypothetical protein
MNFGRLQIATLWRLSKAGVPCHGLVVDGEKALRLIVVEGGQIVQWERFPTAARLRKRAVAILKQRRRNGWMSEDGAPSELATRPPDETGPAPRRRKRGAVWTAH